MYSEVVRGLSAYIWIDFGIISTQFLEILGLTYSANFTARNGPRHGFLLDHMTLQAVIHVADDRKSAKARARTFMQAGLHDSALPSKDGADSNVPPRRLGQWWEGGIYENSYIKEDGIWKIHVMHYHPIWHADFEHGWSKTKFVSKPVPEKVTD